MNGKYPYQRPFHSGSAGILRFEVEANVHLHQCLVSLLGGHSNHLSPLVHDIRLCELHYAGSQQIDQGGDPCGNQQHRNMVWNLASENLLRL